MKTYRLTLTAVLTAFSLVSFCIETLFPPFFFPGAKLGVSNVFVLFALYLLGRKEACFIFLVKVLLGSFFTGNLSALTYALPAGLISFTLEALLFKTFSPVAISSLAATLHNVVQNAVFVLVTGTLSLFVYTPLLAVLGAVAGLFTGLCVVVIVRALPEKVRELFSKGDAYGNHQG